MAIYVYCLSDDARSDALEGASGVAGARPYLIERGSIKAVASEFTGERAALTRENVLAHERVISHVLAYTTPLPLRFGTVVTLEQLDAYIEAERARLDSLLARVRGAVEMNIKVIWDKRPPSAASDEPPLDHQPKATGPGLAFLLAKRRSLIGSEALKTEAESVARWLRGRLSDVSREIAMQVRPGEALVVSAALLVERARLDEYRARLKAVCKERSDLHFLTSGAWPPYSFTHLHS